MKIIMNSKEVTIINDLLINVVEEPLKNIPGIMTVSLDKDYNTTVDINEEYVCGVYGECNKFVPAIVCSAKSLVSLIKTFYNSVNEKEVEILNKLQPKESNSEESSHKVNLKKETD